MKTNSYTLTTAQAKARPKKNLRKTLDFYAEINESPVSLSPTIGMNASEPDTDINPMLSGYPQLYDDVTFNNAVKYERRYIRPQAIDPVAGLPHIVGQGKTIVVAHPQIRVKHFASDSSDGYPHAIVTTGAITEPNFSDKDSTHAERRRLGRIAKDHHTYGALILETEGTKKFHFRHVRGDYKGRFTDLGLLYDGDKDPEWLPPKAMIMPDRHVGHDERKIVKACDKMLEHYQPSAVLWHDFVDMHSVNPHGEDEFIYQKLLHQKDRGFCGLEQELKEAHAELVKYTDLAPDSIHYIIDSNHHRFLDRYLNEGKFMIDPTNTRIGLELAAAFARGENVTEAGLRLVGDGNLPDNIRFVDASESVKINGIELGKHGHQGIFNRRSSIKQKEMIYRSSISGHVHSGESYHNIHTVGTMTPLYPFYGHGAPSNSTHTVGFVDGLGKPQFLNIMPNGKHTIRK